MSIEDNFEKLFTSEDNLTQEKIIAMFFNTKDINTKTEIPDSAIIPLGTLEVYAVNLKKQGLKKTAMTITEMCRLFKELMVSRNRKGREEGTNMLGAIRQQISSSGILTKLFGTEKG